MLLDLTIIPLAGPAMSLQCTILLLISVFSKGTVCAIYLYFCIKFPLLTHNFKGFYVLKWYFCIISTGAEMLWMYTGFVQWNVHSKYHYLSISV